MTNGTNYKNIQSNPNNNNQLCKFQDISSENQHDQSYKSCTQQAVLQKGEITAVSSISGYIHQKPM